MIHFVLMGVSGCGKTSVGQALAERCGIAFVDGDDLHPASNIQKMASGEPLNDQDRAPWLGEIGKTLANADQTTAIGCSALKRKYRDWIREGANGDVHFIHLNALKSVLAERVAERPGHFMPASLLDSQFEALEHLEPGELGTKIDISQSFASVVEDSESYVLETLK